ncbi:hypothetical protein BpHYR1_044942 [Brachionus plicatilis]|uniref:Uncharacterized protein n=1 Tax=Brachionus plicatilis TaxID=10195 RepID=A0A3M7S0E1_BRAPC|nr:hypothetical protein BpHYR1_044942 [Brachionus plicatilis]
MSEGGDIGAEKSITDQNRRIESQIMIFPSQKLIPAAQALSSRSMRTKHTKETQSAPSAASTHSITNPYHFSSAILNLR